MATEDSPPVELMRRAGAVALARTNMPDLGLRINTESSLYGATHNPWKRGRTAGGSSGGEAAAIASGMSPIGLGNDIGGSLRNPAYACGIASIKPSRGRVAQGNPSSMIDMPISAQIMLVNGVLARTVADVRLGLGAVMGSHHLDPQSHRRAARRTVASQARGVGARARSAARPMPTSPKACASRDAPSRRPATRSRRSSRRWSSRATSRGPS